MNKTGKCIMIFGLSGAGKSTLSKIIHKRIENKIDKTVILDGNNIRELFKSIGQNFGFEKKERTKSAKPTTHIINLFLDQNINVIYNNIGLNKKAHSYWNKNIKNLINVYVKADVKHIINFGKKKEIYKLKKNVVGIHIKPEIPKIIDVKVINDFNRPLKIIGDELFKKINKFL